jgi:predicted cobalt transporter CbtA
MRNIHAIIVLIIGIAVIVASESNLERPGKYLLSGVGGGIVGFAIVLWQLGKKPKSNRPPR